MEQVYFQFHAELNDFLPPVKRQVWFVRQLPEKAAVKDAIEALGVPHPEVDLILVNGESVGFSDLIGDGDRVSVYPISGSVEASPSSRVRPPQLAKIQFILDIHLGKLATYLRLLGFDTLYQNDYEDEEIAKISSRENRILLTKDRGLLKRSIVIYGYCVREQDPFKQVVEVLQRFDLCEAIAPLQRCLRCNGLLQSVTKEEIGDRLPPKTREFYDRFSICQDCAQIYWQGAHFSRIQNFIKRIQTSLTKTRLS